MGYLFLLTVVVGISRALSACGWAPLVAPTFESHLTGHDAEVEVYTSRYGEPERTEIRRGVILDIPGLDRNAIWLFSPASGEVREIRHYKSVHLTAPRGAPRKVSLGDALNDTGPYALGVAIYEDPTTGTKQIVAGRISHGSDGKLVITKGNGKDFSVDGTFELHQVQLTNKNAWRPSKSFGGIVIAHKKLAPPAEITAAADPTLTDTFRAIAKGGDFFGSPELFAWAGAHPEKRDALLRRWYGDDIGGRAVAAAADLKPAHRALFLHPGIVARRDDFVAFAKENGALEASALLAKYRAHCGTKTVYRGMRFTDGKAVETIRAQGMRSPLLQSDALGQKLNEMFDPTPGIESRPTIPQLMATRYSSHSQTSPFQSVSGFVEPTYAGAWDYLNQPLTLGDFHVVKMEIPQLDLIYWDGEFRRYFPNGPFSGNPTYVTGGWSRSFNDPEFEIQTPFVRPEWIKSVERYGDGAPFWRSP